VAQSKDGRTVAAVINTGTVAVLTRDQAGKANLRLVPSAQAAYLSMSPDGRSIAVGTHRSTGIKIWSVLDNKLERELPANSAAIPVFSPDGLWLYTTCEAERRLWKVGSWAPGPSLPERSGRFTEDERAAFSPDGRWLALTENSAATTIVDTKTGRPAATLDDPNQDRPYGVAFSPDGGQLVLSTWDSYSIHVWDLRRIRAQLKAIGLDWDAPPYPAPAPAGPLEVRVVGADLDNS
jgi:eukaryotic-like serine/threonine-protein kinase